MTWVNISWSPAPRLAMWGVEAEAGVGIETHNGEAEDEGPETSHRVEPHGLQDAHLMLAVLAIEGIGHKILVDQDLGVVDVVLLQVRSMDVVGHVGLILGLERHDGR